MDETKRDHIRSAASCAHHSGMACSDAAGWYIRLLGLHHVLVSTRRRRRSSISAASRTDTAVRRDNQGLQLFCVFQLAALAYTVYRTLRSGH